MNSQAEKKAKPEAPVSAATTPEVSSPQALRERLAERSRQEPELIAMTLRSWLQETRQ
jgi:hypothetical protein